MKKVNGNDGNGQNVNELKAYYEAIRAKNAGKQEEVKEVKPVLDFKPEKVEVSALDATAAQIWGVQLSNVDKSDKATTKRMEQAFATSQFMASLDELQGIEQENDFASFAFANIKGDDPDKLQRYMGKPLGEETANGMLGFLNALA